jgi:hypothetical protein
MRGHGRGFIPLEVSVINRTRLSPSMWSTRPNAIVYLPSSGGKRILDRNLDMLVSGIVRWRVVDRDAFVWRNREPDVNLKTGAMTMFVTRCDHSYATPDDAMIVLLQPIYLMFDRGARNL